MRSSLKSQARLGDSEALQDLVCHLRYYLLILIIPDLRCLLSAFLFSACPLHVAHIFSVLPTAPPSFTGNPFSPEPLLPWAFLRYSPLLHTCMWSLSCPYSLSLWEGLAPIPLSALFVRSSDKAQGRERDAGFHNLTRKILFEGLFWVIWVCLLIWGIGGVRFC